MSNTNSKIKRGEIYYADLTTSESGSSVQSGRRPVVIIQNDVGNAYSPTTIVVPLTSKNKRRDLPTHVKVKANKETGLRCDSIALLEQVQSIDKDRLKTRVGMIRNVNELNHALKISVGLA